MFIKWTLLLMCSTNILYAQSHSKIYCIGDRLTSGTMMSMPQKNSYPAQLREMLGKEYTVLLNGKDPYANTGLVSESEGMSNLNNLVAERGDMVLLDLHVDELLLKNGTDKRIKLEAKLTALQKAGARVVLLVSKDSGEKIATDQGQFFQDIAFATGAEIVDLSPVLSANAVYLDEKKNLTSIGATSVARRMYELVQTTITRTPNINVKKGNRENFYGYTCTSFDFEGNAAKIVQPKKAAKGNPWIWRARFWGHEPQLDIAMLERGYHIVYCEVSERFGNAEAVEIWNRFYQFLQHSGLQSKAIMEGMSRGGVYIYNWTLRYPDRVSAVYADAPVLDFKSWPGGKGKGKGSPENWEIFKQMYQLTERQALDFKQSPLDKATEIGALKIPAIHVVGDKDDIVPPEENSLPFAKAVIAAGGNLEIIHKPTVGHHPHSLPDPTPIVEFLLRAEGRKINFATVAVPGSEYRSGAGWNPNGGWWGEHDDIDSILESRKDNLDILFLGNSITQGIGGSRSHLPHKPGYSAFESAFSTYTWDCAGIAGDRTQNVLWRLMNGRYKEAAPKAIVVTIGVNNFLDGDTAEEIAAGIIAIQQWIQNHMKDTQLILTGPLPVGLTVDDPRRTKYMEIHRYLEAAVKDGKCIYAPQSSTFIKKDGTLSLADYSSDGIHLSGGYTKWAEALRHVIEKLHLK